MNKNILAVAIASLTVGGQSLVHAEDFVLEEIVVTAQKRTQSLQDVPAAISAVNGETLEKQNVHDIRDIVAVTPSVRFSPGLNSTSTQVKMRGVGTVTANGGFESSVGIFIDGVYQPRPGVALGELVDMAQVEILRGPQGTLFGRNTSVGAMSLSSNEPVIGEDSGSVSASVGSYDMYNLQGHANIDLSENMALRVAGSWRERDGVVESLVPGEPDDLSKDRNYFRAQLLIEPSDEVSVTLAADYASTDEVCCSSMYIPWQDTALTDLPVIGSAYAALGLPANGGVYQSGDDALEDREGSALARYEETDHWGVSAKVVWDLGWGEMTSLTAYRDFKSEQHGTNSFVGVDWFGVPESNPWQDNVESFTQEFHLSGLAFDDRLDWLVGAFYSDETILQKQNYERYGAVDEYLGANLVPALNPFSPLYAELEGLITPAGAATYVPNPILGLTGGTSLDSIAFNEFSQESTSWSIFTHNIFHITDDLSFTLGLRYVEEEKEGKFDQIAGSNQSCEDAVANPHLLAVQGAGSDELQQAFGAMLGLTCIGQVTGAGSQGNLGGNPLAPTYTAAEEFNTDFDDEQLTYTTNLNYHFNEDVSGYVGFTHGFKSGGVNLDPTAAVNGADPTFDSEIVDSWEIGIRSVLLDGRMTANLTLFDMEIEDFQVLNFNGTQFTVFNTPEATSRGAELELTAQITEGLRASLSYAYTDTEIDLQADAAGNCSEAYLGEGATVCGSTDLFGAPEDVVIFNALYEHQLGSDLLLAISPNVRYESGSVVSYFDYTLEQGSSTVYDLTVSLMDVNDTWVLSLWGKNLTDETYLSNAIPGPARGFGPTESVLGVTNEARTFGATFKYNF